MMVDEADIDLVGGGNSTQSGRGIKRPAESPSPTPSRPSKRKVGPLSRDICIKRPFTPVSSPAASPSPPIQPLIGEFQTARPDSPVPELNSPIQLNPVVIPDEDVDRPLVIADYDAVIPVQLSPQVNGRNCPTENAHPEHHPIALDSDLPVVGETDNIRTSPEESLSAISLLTSRLVNGDARGNFAFF